MNSHPNTHQANMQIYATSLLRRRRSTMWNRIENNTKSSSLFRRERLIGLTKTSLKKMLGRALVDEKTFKTILTEIEAALSNTPITHLVTDRQDPEPLTPYCPLYGRRVR